MQDVLVIGSGIFGLSLARKLHRAGRDVLVVDAQGIGSGASATPLGVLAPHAPDRWNDAKEAQFQALTGLPAYLAELERETGHSVGYRRAGRLIPLRTQNLRTIWQSRVGDAARNWRGIAHLSIEDAPDPAWLSPDAARFGAVHCGLSARIDALAYLQALAASIGGERVLNGYELTALTPDAAVFSNDETLRAKLIVLALGSQTFDFLPRDPEGDAPGRGEVGRLVEMALAGDAPAPENRPTLFERGCYVVPRGGNLVAIGVTSERCGMSEADGEAMLEARIAEARTLCPALSGAREVRRWSASRPRMNDKAIYCGPHPSYEGVWVATGGFKTGLATAHTLTLPGLQSKPG